MDIKKINTIGIIAGAVGVGANLISGWARDKKMDDMIEQKVNEVLDDREEKEEES